MATWGSHIRIADTLIKQGLDLERIEFIVGNLGPDCNKDSEDGTGFIPPKKITHWMDENKKVNPEKFYQRHIENMEFEDDKQKAFIIGYYVHLLSDVEWWKFIFIEKLGKQFLNELKLSKDMKLNFHKDWYQHDKVYFDTHDDSSYHYVIEKITDIQIYLDYFNKKDFHEKVKYIFDYYDGYIVEKDREFMFIDTDLINEAFDHTVTNVTKILKEKDLI